MDALERRFTPWLDAVSELVRRPCSEFPHGPLLCLLGQTFDQPVGWNSVGPDGQFAVAFHGAAPDWPPAELLADFTGHVREHPLMQWHLVTGDPSAMTIGRVPDQMVTRRGREVVHDFLKPYGYEEQLSLTCSAQPDRVRAFVLGRTGGDFPDEDLSLARRLQPLLALVARQTDVLARGSCHPSDCAGLTGRELATLQLLDEGLTAAAIGHRLGISPRTVHKHLENVYRKLGVRDRLLASRAAHEAGLLSGPADGEAAPPAAPGHPHRRGPGPTAPGPGPEPHPTG